MLLLLHWEIASEAKETSVCVCVCPSEKYYYLEVSDCEEHSQRETKRHHQLHVCEVIWESIVYINGNRSVGHTYYCCLCIFVCVSIYIEEEPKAQSALREIELSHPLSLNCHSIHPNEMEREWNRAFLHSHCIHSFIHSFIHFISIIPASSGAAPNLSL
jgi:hypothetical protein